MAWRTEKTKEGNDLIWDGVENGIGPSPTTGTANIQNANISTETGEAMASYARTAQQQAAIAGGTLTAVDATLLTAPANLKAGDWITVSASTVSSISVTASPTTASVDYLVVGGGAGGGGANSLGTNSKAAGGGGGAGRVRTGSLSLSATDYPVVIGSGGSGGPTGVAGSDGNSSSISTITSVGGGAGGGSVSTDDDGHAGASGGGGGGNAFTTSAGTGGTATATGNGGNGNVAGSGGGGGGAGGNGTTASSGFVGGNGGNGTASSISGASVTYGGGGGGGVGNDGGGPVPGTGGTGGGGNGGLNSNGVSATANTGGGGGGAGQTDSQLATGGNGGSGIVIVSYTTGTLLATGGVITKSGTKTIHTFTEDGTFRIISIPQTGIYYVSYKNANNQIKLSSSYDPYSQHPLTHGTTGTVTFSTLAVPNAAMAKATEKYGTASGMEYRYYMLDANGYVWVFDTGVYDYTLATFGVGTLWMLPDPTNYTTFEFGGMSILNGWCMIVSKKYLYGKPTTDLGRFFTPLDNAALSSPLGSHSNFAYAGHQGKMYYCDGNYIGSLFPTTSFETNVANIQSFASYTGSTTTGTISAIVGGSVPYDPSLGVRIPAVFFTDQYGTMPTALTAETVYYISVNTQNQTFNTYSAITGGSALDISTGAVGNQYFNTFYPLGSHSGINGDHALVTFSGQRMNLPYFESATCMIEIGNTVLVGGITSTVYPWNQVDATPSDFIPLPEAGVVAMENVNNTAYILAGNKGNVYISNGSVASHVLKIPDYVAGVPGTPLTYIEPYFTWGDISYIRGRVYVSILDQTATKAGNTGGVWSFLPAENFSSSDSAFALRLENQNSYGNYSGMARLILPNQEQQAVSPQYWTFWQTSYSTAASTFGIDYTATTPVTQFIIETDLIPTGSFLAKETFQQLEYKLTSVLAAGDSIELYYRLNATDAWSDSMTISEESANRISGYAKVVFQKTQWVQFRIVCTTNGTTTSSFVRLKQIMLR